MTAKFSPEQTEALTRLLAETVTGAELSASIHEFRAEVKESFAQLKAENRELNAELRAEHSSSIANLRADLIDRLSESETRMMRWGITMIISMATIFTLLDIFID